MNVVRYADRPDLMERRYEELTKPTFPEYMNNNEPGNLYWGRLYTDFPDFQVALVDGDDLLAEAHAVPLPVGRHARGPALGLGRRVRAGDDLRAAAHGPDGDRDQRRAEPAGAAALEPHDPDVHRQRQSCGSLERRDRSGATDVEGAVPAHPDRDLHRLAPGRRHALRPLDQDPRARRRRDHRRRTEVDGDPARRPPTGTSGRAGVPVQTASTSSRVVSRRSSSRTGSARTSSRTSGCCTASDLELAGKSRRAPPRRRRGRRARATGRPRRREHRLSARHRPRRREASPRGVA